MILNSGSIIEHYNKIGAYSHICPGVVLGGGVTIGKSCWVGLGSTVRDHITIGEYCIIGMGSNVTKSFPDHVIAYGNPARVIRKLG